MAYYTDFCANGVLKNIRQIVILLAYKGRFELGPNASIVREF